MCERELRQPDEISAVTVFLGSKSPAMPLTASNTASTEGLKNPATCALYVVEQLERVEPDTDRYRLPLQRQLPSFDTTTVVVVSCRTKLHELRLALLRKGALQPFIKTLFEGVEVRLGAKLRVF